MNITVKAEIARLVRSYESNRAEYIKASSSFNETEARSGYIDHFFAALGWDVFNTAEKAGRFREVLRETKQPVNNQNTKRPDYEFRLGAERRFFVEAKKPSVSIENNTKAARDAAFQVKRYGWSAGLMISVLTNFEHLVIYDTTAEPDESDTPESARLYKFHYTEYEEKIEEIVALLSREVVYSGEFDEQFAAGTQNRAAEKIDAVFLSQLNRWRIGVSTDLLSKDVGISETDLNEISQRLILRILFLRMCEDRGIQTYERLKDVAAQNDWATFTTLLVECDKRYDSGLFDTQNDPFHATTNPLTLDSTTVLGIIESLYFPTAPYTFSVIEPEFLGSVYEQFLTERIQIQGGQIVLVKKPENVDRDIVSTPRPLIDKVVADTLTADLQDLTTEQILQKQLLDPATGSGGFLISALEVLIDVTIAAYQRVGDTQAIYEREDGWHLTFEKKCELLTCCIYGIDRDYLAVEVARFSVLVKLLEHETHNSLPEGDAILPRLADNIIFGDSLVNERIIADDPSAQILAPALTWGEDLPAQFDFIVGNPPYLKTEDMVNLEPVEYGFYLRHYKSAYKQFDKAYLFLENAALRWLRPGGKLGMVVSNKFSHIGAGKKLRRILSSDCVMSHFIDFGNAQLFEGRTTYVCLLFLYKPQPSEAITDTFSYELVASPKQWVARQTQMTMPISLPRDYVAGEASWVLPNTPEELKLLEALATDTVPLGGVVDVFNGIQTSRNAVYVIKNAVDDGGDTVSFTREGVTWEVEKGILKPFFEAANGAPLKSYFPLPSAVPLIFPYRLRTEKGRLRAQVIPSGELQTSYPKAWAWFNHNRETLQKRDISPPDYPADEWYRYGRVQALTAFENRPKIVVGVNSRGDKYVYDDKNTLLASGNTAGEVAIAAFGSPRQASSYDLHFILALLNHQAIEYFCRKRGSPFQGGWFSRGTDVLKEIPIPVVNFDVRDRRTTLYEEITQMSKQLCVDCEALTKLSAGSARTTLERKIITSRRLLDGKISSLYGVESIISQIQLPS